MGAATSAAASLYDRIASSYQQLWLPVIEPASLALLEQVAEAVERRPDAVIVDLGAGTGPLARAAVRRWPGVRAIAVDPSVGMLEVGRSEAARTLDGSARRRLTWLPGIAERLSLDDLSADAVVSSFTFQYLTSRAAALREAYRVLRPGGRLAVVTWLVNDSSFAPWVELRHVLDELRVERPPSLEPGVFRSLPSAAALVRRAGFRNVHADPGMVDYQWTLDELVRCTFESEEPDLIATLDPATLARLERAWRARLSRLASSELRYRDAVAYVDGDRPGPGQRPNRARDTARRRTQKERTSHVPGGDGARRSKSPPHPRLRSMAVADHTGA